MKLHAIFSRSLKFNRVYKSQRGKLIRNLFHAFAMQILFMDSTPAAF